MKTKEALLSAHMSEDSRKELAGIIDRLESLTEEKKEAAARIKAEFEQAVGAGFDKRAIQQILKDRAADSQKTIELRAVVDGYVKSLGSLSGTPLGDWARTWLASSARMTRQDTEAAETMSGFMKSRASKAKADDQPEAGL